MKAWTISRINKVTEGKQPLEAREMEIPEPGPDEVLIKISVCGVCHTELDEIEGRTPPSVLPMIPGHQVVGTIVKTGANVENYYTSNRVGVAWIFSACGKCKYCRNGLENLCSEFLATGRDRNGGYAEYMIAKAGYIYKIPENLDDQVAAPMFCAGAIGHRSVKLAGLENGMTLGLSGFGASAHLVMKMVKYKFPDTRIYVFVRSPGEMEFARELGAAWAGNYDEHPPALADAIIDTTPVWRPVIKALEYLAPGGRLVINAIRKESSDQNMLKELDYTAHLWMEKEIKSVANVAREDVNGFLQLAAEAGIRPEFQAYEFPDANKALTDMKTGKIRGAKVLSVS